MKSDVRSGIFLYGYFGAGNLGDDLLLSVSVEGLRKSLPAARFFVRDHGDISGLPELAHDVKPTGIDTILSDSSKLRIVRLWLYLWAYARLLRQCRWLVFAGGTVFHERGTLTALLLQYMICLLARLRGVRIAALGVGVAELRSVAARWLLRRIIAMTELFLVRDEAALRQCTGTLARLTDDLVFAYLGLKPHPRTSNRSELRIGLTVYPPACDGPAGAKVKSSLVEAIRRWQAHGHAVTFLVCQREGATTGDDAIFAQLAAELGPHASAIDTRRLSTNPNTISQQLADIGVMCGMRFHALVLAAMLGRPFAGVAHDNKIAEICRRFDMPCFAVDNFGGPQFAASVESVSDRIPDPLLLERSRHLAMENFRAFAALAT